jgi:hypothetical protein
MKDASLTLLQKSPTLWSEIVKGVPPGTVGLEPSFSSHPRENCAHGPFREAKRLEECDKASNPDRFLSVE